MSNDPTPNNEGDSVADAIAAVVLLSIALVAVVYWLSTFN
jgi:hypothetical protein